MIAKLNSKMIGSGPPIIILHGLFGMLDNWLTMAKKLEEVGYMPILIDLRDHGRSEHTDDFSYGLMADDLYHFMEENWIHDAIIIGHSMGGKVALQFTKNHESMVSKLIVVDIGIKKYEAGHEDVLNALESVDMSTVESRQDVEGILTETIKEVSTVQFLMKSLTRKKEGGYTWKINLPLLRKKYNNILSEITFEYPVETPTLFVKGSTSSYILSKDFANIQKALPNANLQEIANAGHWVHADRPDELFKIIYSFIKE